MNNYIRQGKRDEVSTGRWKQISLMFILVAVVVGMAATAGCSCSSPPSEAEESATYFLPTETSAANA